MNNILVVLILILTTIALLLIAYLAYLLLDFNKELNKIDKNTHNQNNQNVRNNQNYQNNQNVQKHKGCPYCGSNEFYDWIYTFVICSDCRGLVDHTPFGLKAVMPDASVRFPEILSWWEYRNDDTE